MTDLGDQDLGSARDRVATPSQRRGRGQLGRPPKLSRKSICGCAADIGFAELTVQLVARRLRVSSSAVYAYVKDADDLKDLLATHLVTEIRVPDEASSCEQYLIELGWAIRNLVTQHPGLGLFLLRRPGSAAPWLWLFELMAGGLGARGVRADVAIKMGTGICAAALWWGERHNTSVEAQNSRLMAAGADEEGPLFAAALPKLRIGGPEALFELILHYLVDGMLAVGPDPT